MSEKMTLKLEGSDFHYLGWKFVYKSITSLSDDSIVHVNSYVLGEEKCVSYDMVFEYPTGNDVIGCLSDISHVLYRIFNYFYAYLYGYTILQAEFRLITSKKATAVFTIVETEQFASNCKDIYPVRMSYTDEYFDTYEIDNFIDPEGPYELVDASVHSKEFVTTKAYCQATFGFNPNMPNDFKSASFSRMIIPDSIYEELKSHAESFDYHNDESFTAIGYNTKIYEIVGRMYQDLITDGMYQAFGYAFLTMAIGFITFEQISRIVYESGISRHKFVYIQTMYMRYYKDDYEAIHYSTHSYPFMMTFLAIPIGLVTSGERATKVSAIPSLSTSDKLKNSKFSIYKFDFFNGFEDIIEHVEELRAPYILSDWSSLYSDALNPIWLNPDGHDDFYNAMHTRITPPSGHIRINRQSDFGSKRETVAVVEVCYVTVYLAKNRKDATRYARNRNNVLYSESYVRKEHIFYPKKISMSAVLYESRYKNDKGQISYLLLVNNTLKIGEGHNKRGESIPDEVEYTAMELSLLSDFVWPYFDITPKSNVYSITPTLTVCCSPETMI